MKKLLLFVFFATFCLTESMSQESAICGDWTGVYKEVCISDDYDSEGSKYIVFRDYKRYLRIQCIDNHYTVRMKKRIADNSLPFEYSSECHIIDANDKEIKFKINWGTDNSPSGTYKGYTLDHVDYYKYFTAKLSEGRLKLSAYMEITYYQAGYKMYELGKEIKKEYEGMARDNLFLYKETSDW